MSAGMEQGMKQSMVASATMQMFMKALQSTGMELEQMATAALASNPVLEEAPPAPSSEQFEASNRHERFLQSIAEEQSLADFLKEQIAQNANKPALRNAALLLIERLDEHGYLPEDLHQIATEEGIPLPLAQEALKLIQGLEPAGVGASGLQESLLIQLRHLGESKGIAAELIADYWDELVAHRYAAAAKAMDLDEAAISGAASRIAKLNPNPGSGFARVEQLVITPDVLVERSGEELSVSLSNEHVPQLCLSADYRSMMSERAEQKELRQYLSRCFREGRELIRAIEQRQQCILLISRAIVVRQRDFFLQGPASIKPLKMEQIALDTDVHISTVSRAVNGKYLKCEHGVFELRSFFTSALGSDMGEGSSAGMIQQRIRQLIEEEDKKKPLSDAKLEAALAQEGHHVARRTIAKYREGMKILTASLRKHK